MSNIKFIKNYNIEGDRTGRDGDGTSRDGKKMKFHPHFIPDFTVSSPSHPQSKSGNSRPIQDGTISRIWRGFCHP